MLIINQQLIFNLNCYQISRPDSSGHYYIITIKSIVRNNAISATNVKIQSPSATPSIKKGKRPYYERIHSSSIPKSAFKAWLIVASILQKNINMSAIAQFPEGLKASECERGNGLNPPVPYLPERTDDDSKGKTTTIKFGLAN